MEEDIVVVAALLGLLYMDYSIYWIYGYMHKQGVTLRSPFSHLLVN